MLSNFTGVVWIDVVIGDCWVLVKGHQNLSEGIHQRRVGPSLIDSRVFLELGHTHSHCKALIIKCPRPQKQFPVQRSRCLVKTARIKQHRRPLLPHQQAKFSESEVVADGKAHSAILSLEYADLAALGERLRFLIGNLPRNVDVEEVEFVELFLQMAVGIDHEGSVVELLVMASRNGPDCVHLVLGALFLDGLEGGGVLEVLSELVHVLLDVGGVTDLAQHRHVGTVLACCREGLSDVANVLQLVCYASCLKDGELELFHKI